MARFILEINGSDLVSPSDMDGMKTALKYADAALDALMQPTDGMLLAAHKHHPKAFNLQATKDVFWPAMIRAALDGK